MDRDAERIISAMLRAQERWLEITEEQRNLARWLSATAGDRLRRTWIDRQRCKDGRCFMFELPEGVNPNEDRQDQVDTERR